MPANRSTQPSNVSRFPTAPATAPVTGAAGGASRQQLPVPAHALPHRTPRELLTLARRGLEEAAEIRTDGMRYATAHLAALRAAAAVLAARAVPAAPGRRSKVTSVWSLLVLVAPELSDWAAYFAAGASKRSAAEAGIPRVVTAREADDLMRSAEQFIAVIEVGLGFSYQPRLEGLAS
ncbi:SAV_6107 family HEPN domain-containing protein [Dactylosporangium sp. NPDC050588]|uniref:SAV_6107 family HEPN domain-containing protein n=1 Tax=Dactylosporangium sp. NPDC050588 TaxID=3157211 RepID=UPI0033CDF06A